MKVWRWFVGQVTRLRRSIVGVFAPDAERGGRADEHFASADEPAAGPPEHWVERVRRGAPGLLEPSLPRRGEPAESPVADRVVRTQTEPEPLPDSFEEPEREPVPPEPPVGPRRREAPARAPLLRKVLRRRRSPSAVPPAAFDASPRADVRTAFHASFTLRRDIGESAESPPGPPSRQSRLDETGPTPTRQAPAVADQPERSPRRPEVVELEAPYPRALHGGPKSSSSKRPRSGELPRRSGRQIPNGRPGPVSPGRRRRKCSTRSSQSTKRTDGEISTEREVSTNRVWDRAVPPPAPRRESNVERLREPARPTSRQESSLEPGPSRRSRAEPLSAVDRHPWPELPPPLDEVDTGVEAALRAWDHQQRLDHEQTRL